MRTLIKYLLLWSVTIFPACLDLGLLDEMNVIDSGINNNNDINTAGDTTDDTFYGDTSEGSAGTDPPGTDENDTSGPDVFVNQCGDKGSIIDETCVVAGASSVSVRFETDEKASIDVVTQQKFSVISSELSISHALVIYDLLPESEFEVQIEVFDVNQNVTNLSFSVLTLATSAIVISEVLFNPIGAEPRQEFVEIFNSGTLVEDLSGWMIDDNDDKNGDILPDGTILAPGEIALIVSPDFDSASLDDPAPVSGTQIIRLDSSLGTNGLKNSEPEIIYLMDSIGQQVSVCDDFTGTSQEGCSVIRRFAKLPAGDSDLWVACPQGASTPGSVIQ